MPNMTTYHLLLGQSGKTMGNGLNQKGLGLSHSLMAASRVRKMPSLIIATPERLTEIIVVWSSVASCQTAPVHTDIAYTLESDGMRIDPTMVPSFNIPKVTTMYHYRDKINEMMQHGWQYADDDKYYWSQQFGIFSLHGRFQKLIPGILRIKTKIPALLLCELLLPNSINLILPAIKCG